MTSVQLSHYWPGQRLAYPKGSCTHAEREQKQNGIFSNRRSPCLANLNAAVADAESSDRTWAISGAWATIDNRFDEPDGCACSPARVDSVAAWCHPNFFAAAPTPHREHADAGAHPGGGMAWGDCTAFLVKAAFPCIASSIFSWKSAAKSVRLSLRQLGAVPRRVSDGVAGELSSDAGDKVVVEKERRGIGDVRSCPHGAGCRRPQRPAVPPLGGWRRL
jgi:hypothetical protein